jgi:hypothetical protein
MENKSIELTDALKLRNVNDRNVKYSTAGDTSMLADMNTPGSGNAYGLNEGDTFEVPEQITCASYDVRAGQTNGAKMCLILVNKKAQSAKAATPAWLSLNYIAKRDANRVAVNPEWSFSNYQDLANAMAGHEFRALAAREIDVVAYDDAGNRKVKTDDNFVQRDITKKQKVCPIQLVK